MLNQIIKHYKHTKYPIRASKSDKSANNDESIHPRCGLCGKRNKLVKTPCCGQWICDDEDQYQLFSYVNNSCSRNHSRYTLCGAHYAEGHQGDWKTCKKCGKVIHLGEEGYSKKNLEYSCEKCSGYL